MTGKGGKGLLAGKTTAAAAATKEKDKEKSISQSARAGLQENKDFKDLKDKDVSDSYTQYHQLFGDSYDGDKYAVTPTDLCRTGFGLFEDSVAEDHRNVISDDGESTGSSAEGEEGNYTSSMNASGPQSDEKRKSATSSRKGKKKRVSSWDLFYSVERARIAGEKVAAKINTIMAPKKNAGVACVEELLEAGRLKRRTPLYFYACTLLAQKRYQDMLDVMQDADEKFEWIEWQFNERNK